MNKHKLRLFVWFMFMILLVSVIPYGLNIKANSDNAVTVSATVNPSRFSTGNRDSTKDFQLRLYRSFKEDAEPIWEDTGATPQIAKFNKKVVFENLPKSTPDGKVYEYRVIPYYFGEDVRPITYYDVAFEMSDSHISMQMSRSVTGLIKNMPTKYVKNKKDNISKDGLVSLLGLKYRNGSRTYVKKIAAFATPSKENTLLKQHFDITIRDDVRTIERVDFTERVKSPFDFDFYHFNGYTGVKRRLAGSTLNFDSSSLYGNYFTNNWRTEEKKPEGLVSLGQKPFVHEGVSYPTNYGYLGYDDMDEGLIIQYGIRPKSNLLTIKNGKRYGYTSSFYRKQATGNTDYMSYGYDYGYNKVEYNIDYTQFSSLNIDTTALSEEDKKTLEIRVEALEFDSNNKYFGTKNYSPHNSFTLSELEEASKKLDPALREIRHDYLVLNEEGKNINKDGIYTLEIRDLYHIEQGGSGPNKYDYDNYHYRTKISMMEVSNGPYGGTIYRNDDNTDSELKDFTSKVSTFTLKDGRKFRVFYIPKEVTVPEGTYTDYTAKIVRIENDLSVSAKFDASCLPSNTPYTNSHKVKLFRSVKGAETPVWEEVPNSEKVLPTTGWVTYANLEARNYEVDSIPEYEYKIIPVYYKFDYETELRYARKVKGYVTVTPDKYVKNKEYAISKDGNLAFLVNLQYRSSYIALVNEDSESTAKHKKYSIAFKSNIRAIENVFSDADGLEYDIYLRNNNNPKLIGSSVANQYWNNYFDRNLRNAENAPGKKVFRHNGVDYPTNYGFFYDLFSEESISNFYLKAKGEKAEKVENNIRWTFLPEITAVLYPASLFDENYHQEYRFEFSYYPYITVYVNTDALSEEDKEEEIHLDTYSSSVYDTQSKPMITQYIGDLQALHHKKDTIKNLSGEHRVFASKDDKLKFLITAIGGSSEGVYPGVAFGADSQGRNDGFGVDIFTTTGGKQFEVKYDTVMKTLKGEPYEDYTITIKNVSKQNFQISAAMPSDMREDEIPQKIEFVVKSKEEGSSADATETKYEIEKDSTGTFVKDLNFPSFVNGKKMTYELVGVDLENFSAAVQTKIQNKKIVATINYTRKKDHKEVLQLDRSKINSFSVLKNLEVKLYRKDGSNWVEVADRTKTVKLTDLTSDLVEFPGLDKGYEYRAAVTKIGNSDELTYTGQTSYTLKDKDDNREVQFDFSQDTASNQVVLSMRDLTKSVAIVKLKFVGGKLDRPKEFKKYSFVIPSSNNRNHIYTDYRRSVPIIKPLNEKNNWTAEYDFPFFTNAGDMDNKIIHDETLMKNITLFDDRDHGDLFNDYDTCSALSIGGIDDYYQSDFEKEAYHYNEKTKRYEATFTLTFTYAPDSKSISFDSNLSAVARTLIGKKFDVKFYRKLESDFTNNTGTWDYVDEKKDMKLSETSGSTPNILNGRSFSLDNVRYTDNNGERYIYIPVVTRVGDGTVADGFIPYPNKYTIQDGINTHEISFENDFSKIVNSTSQGIVKIRTLNDAKLIVKAHFNVPENKKPEQVTFKLKTTSGVSDETLKEINGLEKVLRKGDNFTKTYDKVPAFGRSESSYEMSYTFYDISVPDGFSLRKSTYEYNKEGEYSYFRLDNDFSDGYKYVVDLYFDYNIQSASQSFTLNTADLPNKDKSGAEAKVLKFGLYKKENDNWVAVTDNDGNNLTKTATADNTGNTEVTFENQPVTNAGGEDIEYKIFVIGVDGSTNEVDPNNSDKVDGKLDDLFDVGKEQYKITYNADGSTSITNNTKAKVKVKVLWKNGADADLTTENVTYFLARGSEDVSGQNSVSKTNDGTENVRVWEKNVEGDFLVYAKGDFAKYTATRISNATNFVATVNEASMTLNADGTYAPAVVEITYTYKSVSTNKTISIDTSKLPAKDKEKDIHYAIYRKTDKGTWELAKPDTGATNPVANEGKVAVNNQDSVTLDLTGYPENDDNGQKYTYKAVIQGIGGANDKEKAVPDTDANGNDNDGDSDTANDGDGKDKFTNNGNTYEVTYNDDGTIKITNTTVADVKVGVEWVDGNDANRPKSVDYKLIVNNVTDESKVHALGEKNQDNWENTHPLTVYTEDGKPFDYNLSVILPEGAKYVAEVVQKKNSDGEITGLTIKFTFAPDRTATYTAKKKWNNGDREVKNVQLTLQRTLKPEDGSTPHENAWETFIDRVMKRTITADPTDSKTRVYTWTELEESDVNGKPYLYRAIEQDIHTPVDYYRTETVDADGVKVITNNYAKLNVVVTKDKPHYKKGETVTVTVTVTNDGEVPVDTLTMSVDGIQNGVTPPTDLVIPKGESRTFTYTYEVPSDYSGDANIEKTIKVSSNFEGQEVSKETTESIYVFEADDFIQVVARVFKVTGMKKPLKDMTAEEKAAIKTGKFERPGTAINPAQIVVNWAAQAVGEQLTKLKEELKQVEEEIQKIEEQLKASGQAGADTTAPQTTPAEGSEPQNGGPAAPGVTPAEGGEAQNGAEATPGADTTVPGTTPSTEPSTAPAGTDSTQPSTEGGAAQTSPIGALNRVVAFAEGDGQTGTQADDAATLQAELNALKTRQTELKEKIATLEKAQQTIRVADDMTIKLPLSLLNVGSNFFNITLAEDLTKAAEDKVVTKSTKAEGKHTIDNLEVTEETGFETESELQVDVEETEGNKKLASTTKRVLYLDKIINVYEKIVRYIADNGDGTGNKDEEDVTNDNPNAPGGNGGDNQDKDNNGGNDNNGGGNDNTTPGGGNNNTTPGGGNDNTTPGGGNDNTTPGGGNDNTTPGGGNDNTTPGGGNDNTTPGGGNNNTTPGGGNNNTTPGGGNDNTTPGGRNDINDDLPVFTVADSLPNPNDADSPESLVIVDEDGVPLGVYKKTVNDDGEAIYVDEDGVPLGTRRVARTSDDFNAMLWWSLLAGFAIVGFVLRKLKARSK